MPNTYSLELNKDWIFFSPDTLDRIPARVPGTVHNDLLANQIIEDPFYCTNEKDQQWIDKKDWVYQTSFELNKNQLSAQHLELFFEGLDTYAEIFLNEQSILNANHFFRSWRVPVKDFLKSVNNELRIVFRSPTMTGLADLDK